MRQGDRELLAEIAYFEGKSDMDKDYKIGWSWRDVRIYPGTLNRLFKEGYIDNVFKSNSYTGYRLSTLGRAIVDELMGASPSPDDDNLTLPDDLFDDIIGHDNVKELLRAAITAERPVHVLLAGPPALAKTLFLWDIERAARGRALWLVGSATSKAGLWDVVAERHPLVLEIDEIDKMNAADTAALLSMMEGGRLVRAKIGRELSLRHPIRVIAACNRLERLSPELKSRFAVHHIRTYSRADFLTVVRGVLVRQESLSADTAKEIAKQLDGITQDVRDAVRVARLTPQLGVDKAISLLFER